MIEIKGLKSLLPTLRERNRYIAFEIISEKKIRDFKTISKHLIDVYANLFGIHGLAKANIVPLPDKWNPSKQKGIIKVNHKHVHQLKSAMLFIKRIRHKDVIMRSVGISGILKKAQSKYLGN